MSHDLAAPSVLAWPELFARRHPWVIAAAALAAALAAPWIWSRPEAGVAVAATALVLAGVPHGAVDHRVARPLLRPRLGRAWFAAFAALYLGLAALILGLWLVAPALSLLAFLAVSALHFGTEDAEGRGVVAMLARGGAPIALAILWHPERTERFFTTLGGTPASFDALQIAAWAWIPVAAAFAWRLVRRPGSGGEWVEIGAIALVFAALPPLMAFAFYFLVVHSPRHTAGLAARHASGDARQGWGWAASRAVPLSLATLALGALVYLGLDGTFEERFLRTVFWGLAALTVPHMILHVFDRRAGSVPLS